MTIMSAPDQADRRSDSGRPQRSNRDIWIVQGSLILGAVLALVGVVSGVAMALHRAVAACTNHEFPGAIYQYPCISHPHAGEGVAIAVLAAMAGIIIGLGAYIVSILSRPADSEPTVEGP